MARVRYIHICSEQPSIKELVTPQYAFATLLIVSTIDKVKNIACKPYLLTLLQWIELNSGEGFLFWHISNFYYLILQLWYHCTILEVVNVWVIKCHIPVTQYDL